ncbi:MAG TPA: DUF4390 domain-containing protein [Gammaproteobacteria bacterium]|nr:DUF4390 domain-containing protein [Gammaproteobacteria bacterium]
MELLDPLESFLKLALIALLIGAGPRARAQLAEPGHFKIVSASIQKQGGVYYLNARMELRLSSDARDALRSGVPLTIRLDVELLHHRHFWMDGDEAVLRQRYQLEYHALTERYVVLSLNSGDQTSFGTLHAALGVLGRVDMLPLIDASLVPDPKRSYARLRVVLDSDRFPGPLRLLAFWRRDWTIGSDWYRCSLAGK